jgi:peroxiredoxin
MKYYYTTILLFSFFIFGCGQKQEAEDFGHAKPFKLYDTDSVAFSLEDYKNQPVLIHFWADFCAHCRQEFPKIQNAYEILEPKGYEFFAVNAGQSREHVLEIKTTYDLTYPVLVDEEKKIAELYGVTGLPTSLFIDGNGKIREKFIGYLDEKQILDTFKKIEDEG